MTRCIFLAICMIALSVLAANAATTEQDKAQALQNLTQYIEQFDRITGIHLNADVQIKIAPDENPGTASQLQAIASGHYSFWGEESRYRVEVDMNNTAARAIKAVTAYDGAKCYALARDERKLTVGKKLKPTAAVALHNPMLRGLEFMGTANDVSPYDLLQLNDVRRLERRKDLLEHADWVPADRTADGRGYIMITTGKSRNGKPQIFHVHLASADGERQLPSVVEEYGGDILHGRTTIIEFAPVDTPRGRLFLPKKTIQQGYVDGVLAAEFIANVDKCESIEHVDEALFVVDYHDAESVFDDDLGIFVKQAGGYRSLDSVVTEAEADNRKSSATDQSQPPAVQDANHASPSQLSVAIEHRAAVTLIVTSCAIAAGTVIWWRRRRRHN